MGDDTRSSTPKFQIGDVVHPKSWEHEREPYCSARGVVFEPDKGRRATSGPHAVWAEYGPQIGQCWSNPDGLTLILRAGGTPIEPPQKTSGTTTADKAPGSSGRDHDPSPPKPQSSSATTPARGPEEAGASFLSIPTGAKLLTDPWCAEDTFVIVTRNSTCAKRFSDLVVEIDNVRRLARDRGDTAGALRSERDALQRRCDALELRLRRAGLTPPEGDGR